MRADYAVVKGVFIALAYHDDCVRHTLVYDDDRKVCVNEIGPLLKFNEEFEIGSPKIVEYYGEEIADELRKFALKKEVK